MQWLATLLRSDCKTKLYTLLDEGFDADWGECQRIVRHTGRFVEQPDGSYRQDAARVIEGESVEGMGVCEVTIGSQAFTCLRVLDVPLEFGEGSIMWHRVTWLMLRGWTAPKHQNLRART